MSLAQFLFSFQGRVRRLHLWLFLLALSVAYGGLFWQFGHFHVDHGGGWMNGSHYAWYGPGFYFVSHNPAFGLFALVAVWMKLAVLVKRWHDRDKSGWWMLIGLIPFVGGLWILIECGFLDGTPGPNRFGPSPKGLMREAY
ncbi:hypothetical protein AEAC466_12050 [Asticcacaulis sp. AC466]|uniref:DUF805 domain-containing protein n=1 Tax=Asticcacaulis sp. AC466 TaxID=1282362 RepID=UPI0003C3B4FD|nr:DUF805 domain-containing protein [Asticcacaulis sp. AC466]ESQ83732.1 hypothetical protein AEAC466_12050 [Asticcacaulis sp. AC466]